jgi:Ankyrin repeats (3 copies)
MRRRPVAPQRCCWVMRVGELLRPIGGAMAQELEQKRFGDMPQRLMHACWEGDYEQVKALLEKGVSPNQRDELGSLPIISAASRGSKQIVDLLINKGADVNAKEVGLGPEFTAIGQAKALKHRKVEPPRLPGSWPPPSWPFVLVRDSLPNAGPWRRLAPMRDFFTIAFFRAVPLLRRSGPLPGILAAARPGAIMDKPGAPFCGYQLT